MPSKLKVLKTLLAILSISAISGCKPKKLKSTGPSGPGDKTAQAEGCRVQAAMALVAELVPEPVNGAGLTIPDLGAQVLNYEGTYLTVLNLTPSEGGSYTLWKVNTITSPGEKPKSYPEDGSFQKSYFLEETIILPFSGKVVLSARACTDYPSDPSASCGPVSQYRFVVPESSGGGAQSARILKEIADQADINAQLAGQAGSLVEQTQQFVGNVSPYMQLPEIQNEPEIVNLYRSARNILSMKTGNLYVFLREEFLPGIRSMQQAGSGSMNLTAGEEGTEGEAVPGCEAPGFGDATGSEPDIASFSGGDDALGGPGDDLMSVLGGGDDAAGPPSLGPGTDELAENAVAASTGEEADAAGEKQPEQEDNKNMREVREETDKSNEAKDEEKQGIKDRNKDRTRYMIMSFGGLVFLGSLAKLWNANQGYIAALRSKDQFQKTLQQLSVAKVKDGQITPLFEKLEGLHTKLARHKESKVLTKYSVTDTNISQMRAALNAKDYQFVSDVSKALNATEFDKSLYKTEMIQGIDEKVYQKVATKNGKFSTDIVAGGAEVETKGIKSGSALWFAVLASVIFTVGALELAESSGVLQDVKKLTRGYMDAIGSYSDNLIALLEALEKSEMRLQSLLEQ